MQLLKFLCALFTFCLIMPVLSSFWLFLLDNVLGGGTFFIVLFHPSWTSEGANHVFSESPAVSKSCFGQAGI